MQIAPQGAQVSGTPGGNHYTNPEVVSTCRVLWRNALLKVWSSYLQPAAQEKIYALLCVALMALWECFTWIFVYLLRQRSF